MGGEFGAVIVRNRICRNVGRVHGILLFFCINLYFIGQYVLLNSDVDGNNMNKSDAIDKENYIPGEPIFTGDIDIPGMTEENLRYHLKKLTDSGTICRFEPGVYYFPKTDIFGERMSLSPDTVAVHKYIMRRGK